jgi:hypothetical protein
MKSNGYQLFKVTSEGIIPKGDPQLKFEDIEKKINISLDMMGDVTFVILPVYTNLLKINKDTN